MRKVTRIAIAASALVLLSSCNRPEPVDNTQSAITDTAAIEQQIRDIETKWQADYNARNVDALTGHYAEDAALANPGEPLALDSASRRTVLARIVSDPSLKMQFEADRVLVAKSGELAYSRGEYSMQTVDPVTKHAEKRSRHLPDRVAEAGRRQLEGHRDGRDPRRTGCRCCTDRRLRKG